MSWSWKIARVAGIPIYVHWTFLILIAWLVYGHWSAGHNVETTAEGVGFVLAIFGCVVLHELGHALAAKRYGVPTADITLLPIGGVARLQRIPENPWQEFVIAIAGPAVNVAIVAILLLAGVRLHFAPFDHQFLVNERFLPKLMFVNGFIFLFNLLPAFPMDGGRILRAGLAMMLDYAQATRIAASIGQFMAIVFGYFGLVAPNPILLLIAIFVWIGAESEATQVQERLMLRNVPVRDAMMTEFRTVFPSDTLQHAAEILLAGTQHDFPVKEGEEIDAVLTRSALLEGLARVGGAGLVRDATLQHLPRVQVSDPLTPSVTRLREGGGPCLLVADRDTPVGLLTLENVGEYLMVRAAVAQAAKYTTRRTEAIVGG
jgi:Zn-dependent protease